MRTQRNLLSLITKYLVDMIIRTRNLSMFSSILLFTLISLNQTEINAKEKITLHVPVLTNSPNQHLYFHELLKLSLEEAGYLPVLVSHNLPQVRINYELEKGDISLYWLVASKERDEKFNPVEINLTNGSIGKRVLFIRNQDQQIFDKVKNLSDFRDLGLVGGMGKNWFDVKVWKANNLRYKEHRGNWKDIFRMLAKGRSYDYFSRGINEILEEKKLYPDLAIEKKLVLIYDRDYKFYLSKKGKNAGKKYNKLLTNALKKAQNSELIKKLSQKFWAKDLQSLNYENRIKIYLKTPK